MNLTAAIASDPPKSRRFRRIAPLAVLIGLFTVVLGPGLATHVICQAASVEPAAVSKVDPLVRRIVMASGAGVEASLSVGQGG